MAEPSLYERLGGVFAIAAVVDHFSDAIVKNPLVGQGSKNPDLDDWHTNHLDRLPGLKFMRTLWVCDISGGPITFNATKPGVPPSGWKRPIATSTSPPMSSMRSRRSWHAHSTTSGFLRVRRMKSWPPSRRTRGK